MERERSPQSKDPQYPTFAEVQHQVVGIVRYLKLDRAESAALAAKLATCRSALNGDGGEVEHPWEPHNYVLSLEAQRIKDAPLLGPYLLFMERLTQDYRAARTRVPTEQDPRWRLAMRYFFACLQLNRTLNYVEINLNDRDIPPEKRAAHALHFFFKALEEITAIDNVVSHCIVQGVIGSIICSSTDSSPDGSSQLIHVGLRTQSYELKRRIEDKLLA